MQAQTEPANSQHRSNAHRVGLAALVYVFFGCVSSAPGARDASDLTLASAAEPRAATAHAEAPPRAERKVATPAPAARARSDARPSDLSWLSPSHVGAAVRAHHDDFQACQALGDLESRREDGAVTVGWMVRPDGSVNDVTVGPSTFRSDNINTCVLDVARQVTFPRSAASTNVSWTLEFRGAASHSPIATAH